MVAAHQGDLSAAHACGLRTAFVARPLENGRGGEADKGTDGRFDVVASDFLDLAAKLA
jgi:2-haloacid dehalogenase